MRWGVGFGAFVYFVVLFTLGLRTLKRGHGWMFFGIFLRVFWLIGAFIGRTASAEVAYEARL